MIEILEVAMTDPAGLVVVEPTTIEEIVLGDPCSRGDEVLEKADTEEDSP